MCGIGGLISWNRNPLPAVHSINCTQKHRGPDGDGIYSTENMALGHVRLSILDLSDSGAQPMKFRHWVLIYNGELYNFIDLRNQLVACGYKFDSSSDTEVVLKAWDCWGEACLDRFEGMFSFAIYDSENDEVNLCRDNYGVKPLFYSLLGNECCFASELNALVVSQDYPIKIDRDAISTYLALHYIPAPATGIEGVYKLPIGHRMKICFDGGKITAQNPVRWAQPYRPENKSGGVTIDALDKALAHSVEQQMVSDVPVGAFLSGGVDSSLVCHYASRVHSEPLHTFSVGFSDAGSEYDESVYAAQAAKILGTNHHAVTVELGSLSDSVDEILESMGELNADTSVFLNYIVSQEARKHVTVCLSGAGGDELFGGYFRHQALLALTTLQKVPEPIVKTANSLLGHLPQNRDSRFGNLVRRLSRLLVQRYGDGDFQSLLRQDGLFRQSCDFFKNEQVYSLEGALAHDFQFFLGDNILSFSDKMSMLHGLEVRVPFLDPGVVSIAEKMRSNQRTTLFKKKILLKKLAVKYFPKPLIYRKKQGFAAPIEVWLRTLDRKNLIGRCIDGISLEFVPEETIIGLIDGFIEEKKDYSLQIYSLIVMNSWYKQIFSAASEKDAKSTCI